MIHLLTLTCDYRSEGCLVKRSFLGREGEATAVAAGWIVINGWSACPKCHATLREAALVKLRYKHLEHEIAT